MNIVDLFHRVTEVGYDVEKGAKSLIEDHVIVQIAGDASDHSITGISHDGTRFILDVTP
jgi:hypothetical protein